MSDLPKIPAAQYLRMSTEHQQYSMDNQAEAIRRYAEDHGFVVVKTYADPGKSGLMLKHRTGLNQLLQDVVGGTRDYRAISSTTSAGGGASKTQTKQHIMSFYVNVPAFTCTTAQSRSPMTTRSRVRF